jgi:hypothetical protein
LLYALHRTRSQGCGVLWVIKFRFEERHREDNADLAGSGRGHQPDTD